VHHGCTLPTHAITRNRRRARSLSAFCESARRDALPPWRAHVSCTDTRMLQEVQRLTKVMTKVGLGEQAIRRFTDFIARRVDGETLRQVCPRTCLVSLSLERGWCLYPSNVSLYPVSGVLASHGFLARSPRWLRGCEAPSVLLVRLPLCQLMRRTVGC
jgi:hypothetical protein